MMVHTYVSMVMQQMFDMQNHPIAKELSVGNQTLALRAWDSVRHDETPLEARLLWHTDQGLSFRFFC